MVKYDVLVNNMKKSNYIISQLFDVMLIMIPFIYLLPIETVTKINISVYLVYLPCIIYNFLTARKKKSITIEKHTPIKKLVPKEEMEYLIT